MVPDVKMTTPAALSSKYRSEEIRISEGCNVELHKYGAIGTQRMWWSVDVLIRLSRDLPKDIADDAVRTATARDFRTKYEASSTGKAVAKGQLARR